MLIFKYAKKDYHIVIVTYFQKEKRLVEESAEKKVMQPKQQVLKKEKVKKEAEQANEKRPLVEVSEILHYSYLSLVRKLIWIAISDPFRSSQNSP